MTAGSSAKTTAGKRDSPGGASPQMPRTSASSSPRPGRSSASAAPGATRSTARSRQGEDPRTGFGSPDTRRPTSSQNGINPHPERHPSPSAETTARAHQVAGCSLSSADERIDAHLVEHPDRIGLAPVLGDEARLDTVDVDAV